MKIRYVWEVISGGSRIFKREGHKIMDACCLYEHTFLITKTKRWEVVKPSAYDYNNCTLGFEQ